MVIAHRYLQDGTVSAADKEVGKGAYKMPYIVHACIQAFTLSKKTKTPITKAKLLDTLCVADEVLVGQPAIITSVLKLRDQQVNQFSSNPSPLFWINVCK